MEKIAELTHPEYRRYFDDWEKWRLTYEGGDGFVEEYLKKYSDRENDTDFADRKDITNIPTFAKAAVNDVKDAIFQRISDVTRAGGSQSYTDSVRGRAGGVDLAGTTMNSFIGISVLPELLTMGKVGVFTDMPREVGSTLIEQKDKRPYIYYYRVENILNWEVSKYDNTIFTKLLLRDNIYVTDEDTGLPNNIEARYRFMYVEDGHVIVELYDLNSNRVGETIVLNLPVIPFTLFEISDSLLRDTASYQIALLNLASSDMSYATKSNFPFYVEQFDPRVDNLYRRPQGHNVVNTGEDSVQIVQAGERDDSVAAKSYELEVGATIGRRIPRGLELPQFINPSSEPLEASMAKQEILKKDIKLLTKLAVSDLSPKMASAESKDYDERGLEAGLSAIGLELERGERLIAKFWHMFEGSDKETTVTYPQKYSLQSDKDKRDEAKDLLGTTKTISSATYRKEVFKEVADITLGTKVSMDTLAKIKKEIDSSEVIVDPEELHRDIELGLIDLEAASQAKGYPKGSVDKAAVDHAERVARIADSQAKARGVDEMGGISNVSREEKMGKDKEVVAEKKTRGEA
jgi:hypothetical protein